MTDQPTKQCPYCGEQILAVAVKCRFCGTTLVSGGPQVSADPATAVKLALAAKYEILQEVGRGGMAVVYKAMHKNLRRLVALKVLPQQFTHDREFLERFHREAREAARLVHPNIVIIFDEGVENGVHFIAMEYLDGEDLYTKVRKRGRLPVDEAIRFIVPIAEALDYAHRQGVIHRDVKSGNIIVTGSGRVVLMDFGIAYAAAEGKLTQPGTVLGTPEYMSPEQANGMKIDGRSDLYSLAAVLYECLTGHVPHKGENPVSTVYRIIHEELTPPRDLNKDIPEWMQDVLEKGLAKDLRMRYQSGGEFAAALRRERSPAAGGQADLRRSAKAATPQKTIKLSEPLQKQTERAGRWVTPLLVGSIVALVVLLVGLLSDSNFFRNRSAPAPVILEPNMRRGPGTNTATVQDQEQRKREAEQSSARQNDEELQRQRKKEEQEKLEAARADEQRREKEEAERKRQAEELQKKKDEERRLAVLAEQKRKEQEEEIQRKKEEEELRKKNEEDQRLAAQRAEQERREREEAERKRKEEEFRQRTQGMVYVNVGSFEMGSSDGAADERPLHRVSLSPFYMDATEVTVAQYRAFCTAAGRTMPPQPPWGWRDNYPIVNVTWDDANAYAQWVGKRLPSEAEWECAARSSAGGMKYSGSDNLSAVGWFGSNSAGQAHPVGQKQANALGLRDMSGNVWEWCSDWYSGDYYARAVETNPRGPSSGTLRVLRGGAWSSPEDNCRVAARHRYNPLGRSSLIGFRCVLDAR
jgi:serine/threonine protein kinase/formylglycine-generating enzyme required for sulfatase activity